LCDFTVVYGPVQARDIKRYLKTGMNADPGMRRVTFGMIERLTVAWLELVQASKKGLIVSAVLYVSMGIGTQGFSPLIAWERSSAIIGLIAAGILSGTLLTAVLLPLLPGKAFSFKGGVLGAVITMAIVVAHIHFGQHVLINLSLVSPIFFATAISAYLALNFTGCSTYTSLSGVKKEMQISLPIIIGLVLSSGLLLVVGRIFLI
jgi:hypothetical protein